MWVLLAPLAVSLDMLLTLYIVRTYGLDEEGNPLIRRGLARYGVKFLFLPILAALIGSLVVQRVFGHTALVALAAVCAFPVVWNCGYIVLRGIRASRS